MSDYLETLLDDDVDDYDDYDGEYTLEDILVDVVVPTHYGQQLSQGIPGTYQQCYPQTPSSSTTSTQPLHAPQAWPIANNFQHSTTHTNIAATLHTPHGNNNITTNNNNNINNINDINTQAPCFISSHSISSPNFNSTSYLNNNTNTNNNTNNNNYLSNTNNSFNDPITTNHSSNHSPSYPITPSNSITSSNGINSNTTSYSINPSPPSNSYPITPSNPIIYGTTTSNASSYPNSGSHTTQLNLFIRAKKRKQKCDTVLQTLRRIAKDNKSELVHTIPHATDKKIPWYYFYKLLQVNNLLDKVADPDILEWAHKNYAIKYPNSTSTAAAATLPEPRPVSLEYEGSTTTTTTSTIHISPQLNTQHSPVQSASTPALPHYQLNNLKTKEDAAFNNVQASSVQAAEGYFTNIRKLCDANAKKDIQELSSAEPLDIVKQFKIFLYKYKEEYGGDGSEAIGFIAQQLQSVYPHLVQPHPNGLLSIKHDDLLALLAGSIKQLSESNENLSAKMARLSTGQLAPIQLISFGARKIAVNHRALKILANIDAKISVVGVCGQGGDGNSTLCNNLQQTDDKDYFFKVRGTTERCVWMSIPIIKGDTAHIVLDSQGYDIGDKGTLMLCLLCLFSNVMVLCQKTVLTNTLLENLTAMVEVHKIVKRFKFNITLPPLAIVIKDAQLKLNKAQFINDVFHTLEIDSKFELCYKALSQFKPKTIMELPRHDDKSHHTALAELRACITRYSGASSYQNGAAFVQRIQSCIDTLVADLDITPKTNEPIAAAPPTTTTAFVPTTCTTGTSTTTTATAIASIATTTTAIPAVTSTATTVPVSTSTATSTVGPDQPATIPFSVHGTSNLASETPASIAPIASGDLKAVLAGFLTGAVSGRQLEKEFKKSYAFGDIDKMAVSLAKLFVD